MRYKILIFGIIFFACIIIAMEVDKGIQAKILNIGDYVKVAFLDSKDSISSAYNRHFNQADYIKDIENTLKDYQKLSLQKQELLQENAILRSFITQSGSSLDAALSGEDTFQASSDIHTARIVSYSALNKRDSVWLQSDLSSYRGANSGLDERIYGIVKDNVALGVAIVRNGRLEGLLNGNEECHYDVYIGENRVLGIVSGKSNGYLLIDYVPSWAEIKRGDAVFTSGLDGIFLENVPVGVVENVKENFGYLSAEVKTYAQEISELSYVWVIDRNHSSQEPKETDAK